MFQRIVRIAAFAAALSIASTSVAPTHASAQTPVQQRSGHKGLFGLGIVGAELGLVIPAAAGLDQWWALVVFPVVGAAGGAIAGHYALDNNNQAAASTGILAISIALVIPSVVLTVALRAYDPGDEGVENLDEDEALPDDDAEAAAEEAALRRRQSVARAGTGILRVSEFGVHLGMPAIQVSGMYSQQDLALLGGRQQTEVSVSLLSGVF